jgi:hypothetical protein
MKRPTVDPNTALAAGGLVLLSIGLAIVSLALALSVVGVLLIGYAILPDQRRAE